MDMSVIELADRVRLRLDRTGITERKMFGGIAFMLHGNMICGVMKGGAMIMRVGKDGMDDALSRPGAQPMKMGRAHHERLRRCLGRRHRGR